jgi:hypothetical protein
VTVFVPVTPSGYTIFCDDVRQEASGKLLFVGVYTNEIVVHGQPPQILPSFVAFVNYLQKPTNEDTPVTLKLFLPGQEEEAFQMELPLKGAVTDPQYLALADEDVNFRVMVPIKLVPLPITQEGFIKVRAYRGGDEIRLGALRVRFQSDTLVNPPRVI